MVDAENSPCDWEEPSAPSSDHERTNHHPLWVRLACILLDFLTQVYDQIRIVPEIALIKRSVCQSYYARHDLLIGNHHSTIPDYMCRIHPIQSEVARLRSYKALFDGLAILITAVPLGMLADRLGRRKIIAISILGVICSTLWTLTVGFNWLGTTDIRLIWLSSVFLLIGNLSSANASIYAMAADACPPTERSQYFYYLYSTFLVCELFTPALASYTMEKSLLIPFVIGIGALMLVFPVVAIMPETSRRLRVGGGASTKSSTDACLNSSDEDRPLLTSSEDGKDDTMQTSTLENLRLALNNFNILIALFALFTGALRQGTVSMLLQYVDARFGWPMSKTAMLVSGIAAVNIVLFLVALPQVMVLLTKAYLIPSTVIDYHVVSVSLVTLCVGALAMGFAQSTAVLVPATLLFAAGYGTRVAVLSLITVWTTEDVRASIFGMAQIIENLGRMTGDPLLLKVFDYSLQLTGIGAGLPFFVASLGFGAGALAWQFVRRPITTLARL